MKQRETFLSVLASAALVVCATSARADVQNGSFEGGPAANSFTTAGIGDSTTIPSWTVINNDGSVNNNGRNVLYIGNGAFGISTPFGLDFLDLTGTTDSAPFAGVRQTVQTNIGQQYALSFYLGVNAAGANNGGTGGLYGPPISVDVSAGAASQLFTDLGTSGTETALNSLWTPYTFNFTATSTTTDLSFIGESGIQFIGLDNVALNGASPVGAPAPLAGAGLLSFFGAGGVAMRKRARRMIESLLSRRIVAV